MRSLLFLVISLLFLLAVPAPAATFTVNSTADRMDANLLS
jgi:hypothetical protein